MLPLLCFNCHLPLRSEKAIFAVERMKILLQKIMYKKASWSSRDPHSGLGETSSIDFGLMEDEPLEPCDCFMVFFRVSLA